MNGKSYDSGSDYSAEVNGGSCVQIVPTVLAFPVDCDNRPRLHGISDKLIIDVCW